MYLLLRERAKPTIICIKDLLYYSNSFGHSERYCLSRPPLDIKWQLDNSASGLLTVTLRFKEGQQITVLEAHNVKIHKDLDDLIVIKYLPGNWISVLQKVLNAYKSNSYMQIDDSSVVADMQKAFSIDSR